MTKLLHIDTSITGEKSISRRLSSAIVARLKAERGDLDITYYNLDETPIAHLSSAVLNGQAREEALSGTKVLEDFKAANIVVIGAPMYNFSVPSQLKAWIDRIAVAGETFRYTPNGPEGLAGDKRVIVASVRGGYYGEESGLSALDHQENYLKTVFGFLGVKNLEFIRAEGVNTGSNNAEKAINAANRKIVRLAA